MDLSKDLVAASATPLVLAILAEGDSYGYAIIKRVARISGGQLQWTDGMLYPVLHRLERRPADVESFQQRFDDAVDRVRERIRLLAAARPSYLARLVARVRNQDVVIPIDDVDYIEADDVYAGVHANGRRYLVRTPLDALEGRLDPSRFVRVHRSYIVATKSVTAIRRSGARCVLVLRDGVVLPVSRRRHARLTAAFGRA